MKVELDIDARAAVTSLVIKHGGAKENKRKPDPQSVVITWVLFLRSTYIIPSKSTGLAVGSTPSVPGLSVGIMAL